MVISRNRAPADDIFFQFIILTSQEPWFVFLYFVKKPWNHYKVLFRCVLVSLYEALSVRRSVRRSVRPSVGPSVGRSVRRSVMHSSKTCNSRSRRSGMIGDRLNTNIRPWGCLETSNHSHLRNHLSHLWKKSDGRIFVPTGTCRMPLPLPLVPLSLDLS